MLQILFIFFGIGLVGLLFAISPFFNHGADGLGGFFFMIIFALMVIVSTLMIITIYLKYLFGNYAFIFPSVCLVLFCWWSYRQMFPVIPADTEPSLEVIPLEESDYPTSAGL